LSWDCEHANFTGVTEEEKHKQKPLLGSTCFSSTTRLSSSTGFASLTPPQQTDGGKDHQFVTEEAKSGSRVTFSEDIC